MNTTVLAITVTLAILGFCILWVLFIQYLRTNYRIRTAEATFWFKLFGRYYMRSDPFYSWEWSFRVGRIAIERAIKKNYYIVIEDKEFFLPHYGGRYKRIIRNDDNPVEVETIKLYYKDKWSEDTAHYICQELGITTFNNRFNVEFSITRIFGKAENMAAIKVIKKKGWK
jgi:hypothetical protein